MAASLFQDLQARGFVAQTSHPEPMEQWLESGPCVFYCGYDPTAHSLHVGHLLTMMLQRAFLRRGHRCIVLMGGATALIGDPSGKQQMRPMLAEATVAANTTALFQQLQSFHGAFAEQLQLVNNNDWLGNLNHLQLLRHIGPHFSVPRMLRAETYKRRLEDGLTLLELHYQVLQAIDFCHLQQHHQCRLQIGGDDQWSNMLAGIHLCQKLHQQQLFAWTVPLLTTSSGEKMGKTAQGAIWLDSQRTSPYVFFQYWRNCQDADLLRWLALFTELPLTEIAAVALDDLTALNTAKLALAFEVTKAVHGQQAALEAWQGTLAAFGQVTLHPELLPSAALPRQQTANDSQVPTFTQPLRYWQASPLLVEILLQAEVVPSKAAARRLIEQQAILLDGQKITDAMHRCDHQHISQQAIMVRIGKKRWLRLVCQDS